MNEWEEFDYDFAEIPLSLYKEADEDEKENDAR